MSAGQELQGASQDDMDRLLDEALDGFSQPDLAPSPADRDAAGGDAATAAPSTSAGSLAFDPLPKPGGKKKAAPKPALEPRLPQEAMAALEGMPPDLAKQMARLMQEMSDATTGEPQMVGDESKVMDLAATLSSLAEETRATAGPEVVPDEVNDALLGKLTEQLGSMQDSPEVNSLIDGLMQQLLSKEVLYQPMKDIASKYPEWLEKNRGSLPKEELEKYEKQHSSIIEVCTIYETEPLDFDRLVIAMQEVQSCGQPPSDIVAELAPGLQFDSQGLPTFPGMPGGGPEQCTIQ